MARSASSTHDKRGAKKNELRVLSSQVRTTKDISPSGKRREKCSSSFTLFLSSLLLRFCVFFFLWCSFLVGVLCIWRRVNNNSRQSTSLSRARNSAPNNDGRSWRGEIVLWRAGRWMAQQKTRRCAFSADRERYSKWRWIISQWLECHFYGK